MEEQALCESSRWKPSEEQALATYHHAAEERRFLRSQQWHVTNSTLIAYAALAAAPTWVGPDSWRSTASWLALLLAFLAVVQAWRVLAGLQWQLNRERQRQREVRERLLFIREVQNSLENTPRPWQRRYWTRDHEPGTARNVPLVSLNFFAVVVLGWIIASLITLSRIPSVQRVVACIST